MKLKLLTILITFFCSASSASPMKQFQEDADLIRLEHLEYWTEIIEKYHQVKGSYPFQQ